MLYYNTYDIKGNILFHIHVASVFTLTARMLCEAFFNRIGVKCTPPPPSKINWDPLTLLLLANFMYMILDDRFKVFGAFFHPPGANSLLNNSKLYMAYS